MAKFRAVNCVAMSGRLTADPLITKTSRGTTRMFFTIACNQNYRSSDGTWQEKTDFAGVTIWAEQADALARLTKGTRKQPATLKKGTMVFVDGSFESSRNKDKFYSGIRANKVALVDMDDPVEVGENAPVKAKEVHIETVTLSDVEGDDVSEPEPSLGFEKEMQLGATAVSVLTTGLI